MPLLARQRCLCGGSIPPARLHSCWPFLAPRQTCLARTIPRFSFHFLAPLFLGLLMHGAKYRGFALRSHVPWPTTAPTCLTAASSAAKSLPYVLLGTDSLRVTFSAPDSLAKITRRDIYPDIGGYDGMLGAGQARYHRESKLNVGGNRSEVNLPSTFDIFSVARNASFGRESQCVILQRQNSRYQCISMTGTIMLLRRLCVVPPRTNSWRRLWP